MVAFDPSSFTETESEFSTEVVPSQRRFNETILSGAHYFLLANAVTTTVEFRGLSRSAAQAMAKNADYNYRNLHGVFFSSGSAGAWMRAADCEGTECKAVARRINEADMWRVIVTHISTTVTHSDGWTKTTF